MLATNFQDKLRNLTKVALGGEFSSGKSTLATMFLGQHVVETQASANAAPTIVFKYSEQEGSYIIDANGSTPIPDFEALTEEDLRAADRIEVHLDLPILKTFEIYDTPGTSDPTRHEDQLLKVAEQVDTIIWCTNATQAWRESERRMWAQIPDEIKPRSTLVVTHVDLPNVKASLDRLLKRLNKEAGPHFGTVIPMDIPSAVIARSTSGEILDESQWANSGGYDCLEAINAVAASALNDILALAKAALQDTINPAVANMIVHVKPQSELFVSYWERSVEKADTEAANDTDIEPAFVAQRYINLLVESERYVSEEPQASDSFCFEVGARLTEAKDFLKLEFRRCEIQKRTELARRVIKQLNAEITHLHSMA